MSKAQDLLASVVVFLVALPLCMGIAIASGVPPAMGLLSGIVGGLVVGFLAGSPMQVSGPAAGLAVIVLEAVQQFGVATLGAIVLLAGLIQIAAGFLKVGQLFRSVAPAVIYAMLAGIGVLIFASQFHVMVDAAPFGSGLDNLIGIPSSVLKGVTPTESATHHWAALVGVVTLAILVVWNALKSAMPAGLAKVPAPLLAVTAATAVAQMLGLNIVYVDVPAGVTEMVNLIGLPQLTQLANPAILGTAVALAVVASAESLLCATAVDKLHDGPQSDLNKELVAQGVGNSILGILGGLPLTGVIVRSTANLEAGGQTRWSAIFHGAWLLIMITALPWVLQLIPVASLAAVLVYIGYKLVNVAAIKELYGRGKGEIAVYGVTVVSIVSINLLDGLMIGFVCSVFHLAWKASRLRVNVTQVEQKKVAIDLRGSATFLVLNELTAKLDEIEPEIEVRFQFDDLAYIDHACLTALREWGDRRTNQGGSTVLELDELEEKSKGLFVPEQPLAPSRPKQDTRVA